MQELYRQTQVKFPEVKAEARGGSVRAWDPTLMAGHLRSLVVCPRDQSVPLSVDFGLMVTPRQCRIPTGRPE